MVHSVQNQSTKGEDLHELMYIGAPKKALGDKYYEGPLSQYAAGHSAPPIHTLVLYFLLARNFLAVKPYNKCMHCNQHL